MTTSILILRRIRPLSNKEIKSGDEMAVQFPGDGQIYVSARIVSSVKWSILSYPILDLDSLISEVDTIPILPYTFLHNFPTSLFLDNNRDISDSPVKQNLVLLSCSATRLRAAATKNRRYSPTMPFSSQPPRRKISCSTPVLRTSSKWRWRASAAPHFVTDRPEVAKRILWLDLRDS